MDAPSQRKPPRKRRLPRQATAAHLENAALHYLERFSSSSANLRRVLLRKVARSARAHGTDPAEGAGLVEAIITRYLQSGLLDDAAYAAQKAASLRRRGTSRYGIRGKLAVKGVDADLIGATLERLDEEQGSGDLVAACALVRRRRLGPYRSKEARVEHRRKDLASLARAGFSLDVARRVLAAVDGDAVEAMARGEEPD
ncbi:MAG TPA: RecX family transcriptional regulator [Stellaceae bacterium]|nr:RecX family transcriptional regulator [Stellaceae bacterium]